MEDLKFVKETIDMFEDDGNSDTGLDIDRIVEQRIESIGSGPLGGFQQGNGGGVSNDGSSDIEQKLDELIDSINGQGQAANNNTTSSTGGTIEDDTDEEIDSMFEDSTEEEAEDSGQEEEPATGDSDSGEEDFSLFTSENADGEDNTEENMAESD